MQITHNNRASALFAFLCLSPFAVAPVQAASDYAPFLNGNGYYMDTTYNGSGTTGVIPTSGDFTVEFWAICPKVSNTYREIISQGTPVNAFYIGTDLANNIRLGDSWSSTGIPYPVGGWHHFALVKSSTNTIFYLDGTNRLSRASAISNPSNTAMRLGRQYANGAEYWIGGIDEVRIWSVARSAEEIFWNKSRQLTGSESGLRNYWQFNANNSSTSMSRGYNSCWIYSRPDNDIYWQASGVQFVPAVTTVSAQNIIPIGATLNGIVNSSLLPASAWFEWGDSTLYGNQTPPVNVDNLDNYQTISSTLSNLTQGMTYHYRLVTTNVAGMALGNDLSFQTLNFVVSASAAIISPTSATLNGTVKPFTAATTTWFEWGPNTNYGQLTAVQTISVAQGEIPVSSTLTNLMPGVAYHFRLHATNSLYQAAGNDLVLIIPPFNAISNGIPAFEYSSMAWGDYNNDGWLDILISGQTDYNNDYSYSAVYRNNGLGTFTDINAGLASTTLGALAWGDYDNDGWLDILTSGMWSANYNYITRIYHNNGDGTFTANQNTAIPGLLGSSAAWGDYNNDARLDFLISGHAMSGDSVTYLFANNGDGTFTDINANLPGTDMGAILWFDYDNDGWRDVLVDSSVDRSTAIRLFRNNRDGTFTDIQAGLPVGGTMALGDYNNDGFLDILLSRYSGTSRIYRNNGDGTFTDIQVNLPALASGCLAWGDQDNDGWPDVLLAGYSAGNHIAAVYRNNKNGTFTDINLSLPGTMQGSAVWGDYNNDGRLDFLLTGWSQLQSPILIYQNNNYITNTPPIAPTDLTPTLSSNRVVLSWSIASDAQTPAPGLTYNVRIGTRPGGTDILSPASDPVSGFRRIQQMGNAQHATQVILDLSHLPPGTQCYWSVQSVDTTYAGSPWALEGTFTLPGQPCFIKCEKSSAGRMEFQFTGAEHRLFTLISSTNLASPLNTWLPVGSSEELTPGLYRCADTNSPTDQQRFYRLR